MASYGNYLVIFIFCTHTKVSFFVQILRFAVPQHSTSSMCTGHPVFHYSAFAMGLNFITAKDKLLSVIGKKTLRI